MITRFDVKSVTAAVFATASCLFSALAFAQLQQFPKGEFPLTNHERSSIELSEILSGGPPRDGIPPIDAPEFVSIEQAQQWLQDQEPVVALTHNGESRAYPLQILMYHEIVNDQFGSKPVAVTFCPLCNASIVFDRTVGSGEEALVLDFGTTGRLRKSDLVMYDRQTESWWQQFSGEAIVGDYTDTVLRQLPSQIVSFATFRQSFGKAKVLSRDTGFSRPYGNNPYRGYDDINSNPFLFDGKTDPRLPAMERVLSIASENSTHLLPLTPLADKDVLNLRLDGKPVAIFAAGTATSALDEAEIAQSRLIPAAAAFDPTIGDQPLNFKWQDGAMLDEQTGSQWNAFGLAIEGELAGSQLRQMDSGVHFAFAWLAFDPAAKVVTLD